MRAWGVPHVLNDDLKLPISDLNKVSNADNNPEPTFETTDCKYYGVHDFNNTLNTTAILLRYISIFLHCQNILTSLTPYCPSCNTTLVSLAFLKQKLVLNIQCRVLPMFQHQQNAGVVILYISNTLTCI